MDFWNSLDNPKYVLAPMVELGDLAFRLLTRKYGVELSYSPAIHSRLYVQDTTYRKKSFSTVIEENPVIAQFSGNNPEFIYTAANMLCDKVAAIDINFGCPQGIARRGNYGAYLLKDPNLVEHIVAVTVLNSKVPVTCKLRKVSKEYIQETLNLAKRLEQVGCSAICLHARTIENKGQNTQNADWNILKYLKTAMNIPVIGNGGIASLEDANRCLLETKICVFSVDAVMSAEGILDYPALFSKSEVSRFKLMEEYIELARQCSTPVTTVKAHIFRTLYLNLQENVDLRTNLTQVKSIDDIVEVCSKLKERYQTSDLGNKLGWYMRHRLHNIL